MIFELVQDFADVLEAMPAEHPRRRILQLLDEAIRRDVHFIERHPTTLFQCLWNSCWWYDCAEAEEHYWSPKDGWPREGPPWQQPEPRLSTKLASWRAEKEKRTPGFVWLRSLRPPQVHLGITRLVLQGHEGTVSSLAFSPNARFILSGSSDETVRVWDLATGEELAQLTEHTAPVLCVAFALNGYRMASGSADGTARVWEAESHIELCCCRGHQGPVVAVALSPDGECIVSGGQDKTVRIWRVSTGTELHRFASDGDEIRSVAFSPDGKRIVSGSADSVRVNDVDRGAELMCLRDVSANTVLFSADSERFFCVTDRASICIRSAADGQLLREHDLTYLFSDERFKDSRGEGLVLAVAISPDGNFAAIGSVDGLISVSPTEARMGPLRLYGHEGPIRNIAFSQNGRRLASGSEDRSVCVWHVPRLDDFLEAELLTPPGDVSPIAVAPQAPLRDSHNITSMAFSPDGQHLVCASEEGSYCIDVWDVAKGRTIARRHFPSRLHTGCSLAFSPDGRYFASGSVWGPILIWKAVCADEPSPLGRHEGAVVSVVFSADGRQLVSGSEDKTVGVWDLATGSEVARFSQEESVTNAAFSADGRHVVSESETGVIRIWEVASAKEVARLFWRQDGVNWISFLVDHERVIARLVDGTVRAWDLNKDTHPETMAGPGDSSILGVGAPFLWRALVGKRETAITFVVGGHEIGWFPATPKKVQVHPGGRMWAGAAGKHLYLFTVEGDPDGLELSSAAKSV